MCIMTVMIGRATLSKRAKSVTRGYRRKAVAIISMDSPQSVYSFAGVEANLSHQVQLW